jgi:hypothetical protein
MPPRTRASKCPIPNKHAKPPPSAQDDLHFLAFVSACRKPHPSTTRQSCGFEPAPHTLPSFRSPPSTHPCAQRGKPRPKLPPPVLFYNLLSSSPPTYGNHVPTIHPASMRILPPYPLFHPQRLLLLEISILLLSFLEAFSPAAFVSHPHTPSARETSHHARSTQDSTT